MTDLIWASDTWKNPLIMKIEEMSPDTKTPYNQITNFVNKFMGNKQTKKERPPRSFLEKSKEGF